MTQHRAYLLILSLIPALALSFAVLQDSGTSLQTHPLLTEKLPVENSHTSSVTTSILLNYDQAISTTSVTTRTFPVFTSQTGRITPTFTVSGTSVVLDPAIQFFAGEKIQFNATRNIYNIAGQGAISPTVWEFRTQVARSLGVFNSTNQVLGDDNYSEFTLGDLNNDGTLDLFLVNQVDDVPGQVWLNNGLGYFNNTGQSLSQGGSYDVTLGDIDQDGDLDAVTGNYGHYEDNCTCVVAGGGRVWLNDGNGFFTMSGQTFEEGKSSVAVALGDMDGDGDLDVFFTNTAWFVVQSGEDTIWFNDGQGYFTKSSQNLGDQFGVDVALGDMDNDGDLDAFVANEGHNEYWFNDGTGYFFDSGQVFDNSAYYSVDMGDLDGDYDLDVFLALSSGQPDQVWFNNGAGYLTRSSQDLGTDWGATVKLGDLEGDGDLDALVTNNDMFDGNIDAVWLNDSTGVFTLANQIYFTQTLSSDLELGDIDNDGDLDALISTGPVHVWKNLNMVLALGGPLSGLTDLSYTFTASLTPPDINGPITYTWEATDQTTSIQVSNNLTDTMAYVWLMPGTKIITLTASNQYATLNTIYSIQISKSLLYLPLISHTPLP